MKAMYRTYYFDEAVFGLASVIKTAEKELKKVDFDTMVGTGFSGSIVIPSLALAMGKKFTLIRKETDDSHHGRGRMVGELGSRWVFVDDFISSGNTRSRVFRKVAEAALDSHLVDPDITMVGQYMYQARSGEQSGFTAFDPEWVSEELRSKPFDLEVEVRRMSYCPCELCQSRRNNR